MSPISGIRARPAKASTVLIPLVVGSITQGLNGPQSAAELRSVSFGFLVYVLVATTAAATLGIVLVNTLRPGDSVTMDAPLTARWTRRYRRRPSVSLGLSPKVWR